MTDEIRPEEWYKKAKQADIKKESKFFCKIGNVEARLTLYIETDPHGNGTGDQAHFHVPLLCPKIKIVDYPEPDRCVVTDQTCPYWEPVGGYKREVDSRKWVYAHQFLHQNSLIEFYLTQLLNVSFKSNGYAVQDDLPELRSYDLIKLIVSLNILDKATCKDINNLRERRNKLTHGPDQYLKYSEKDLYELWRKAQSLTSLIREKVTEVNKKD